jgi:hypothetical protein
MFDIETVQSAYKYANWSYPLKSRVDVGSNISTVALRVVGADEKGNLESETVKYSHESHGNWTRK